MGGGESAAAAAVSARMRAQRIDACDGGAEGQLRVCSYSLSHETRAMSLAIDYNTTCKLYSSAAWYA